MSQAGRPTPRQLPRDVTHFTGRGTDLAALDATLVAGPAPSIVVIDGPPGVGKTALATHWAVRIRDRFPGGQLHANLRGFDSAGPPTAPREVINGFLRSLGVPPTQIPPNPQAELGLYRSLMYGRRAIVLLDNVSSAEQVRPLLPGSPASLTLITSRSRLSGLVANEGAHRITLGLMSPEEAFQLLRGIVGTARAEAEPEATRRVAAACEFLPLALRVAAERITISPHTTLSDLAVDLADERHRLEMLSTDDDESTAMSAVFSWSYRALPAELAHCFRLLGLHTGTEISGAAAAALTGRPAARTRALLDGLAEVNLLVNPAHDRYLFHDLVRLYAVERCLAEEPELAKARTRLLAWYLGTALAAARTASPAPVRIQIDPLPPGVEPLAFADRAQALAWCEQELPNLVAAVSQAAEHGEHRIAWQLPSVLWYFFSRWRSWVDWIATHHVALASAHAVNDQAAVATTLISLGDAYKGSERFAEAIDCFHEALALSRQIGDRWLEGWALYNLGDATKNQGRADLAVGYLEQAVRIASDPDREWELAWTLHMLGDAYRLLNRNVAALEHLTHALALRQRLADPVGESWTQQALGEAYLATGRPVEAVAALQRALAISQKAGLQLVEAASLRTLGEAWLALDDVPSATTAWNRALAVFDQMSDIQGADAMRARLAEQPPS